MNIPDIIKDVLTNSDGEKKIKQYHCTHLHSKLLGIKAEGLLAVSTKRVVFRANGTSFFGDSVIQSEIPMEDVSGVSFYKGTYFSLKHLLLAFILSIVIWSVFMAIMGASSISSSMRSMMSTSRSDVTWQVVFSWVIGCAGLIGSFVIDRRKLWNPLIAALGASAFSFLASGSSVMSMLSGMMSGRSSTSASQVISGILLVVMLINAIVTLVIYCRRLTMTLSVGSKGGASAPIFISGLSGKWGLSNSAAPKALEADPTEDSDRLIKELGALIQDVQTLGDYAVEKWSKS